MAELIRVGLVGAGGYTTGRILPGFQKAAGCEVTTVANSTSASSERVADAFGISHVAEGWQDVVASPEVDAVFIGTPPNLHMEVVLAALAAGKHVLCQT